MPCTRAFITFVLVGGALSGSSCGDTPNISTTQQRAASIASAASTGPVTSADPEPARQPRICPPEAANYRESPELTAIVKSIAGKAPRATGVPMWSLEPTSPEELAGLSSLVVIARGGPLGLAVAPVDDPSDPSASYVLAQQQLDVLEVLQPTGAAARDLGLSGMAAEVANGVAHPTRTYGYRDQFPLPNTGRWLLFLTPDTACPGAYVPTVGAVFEIRDDESLVSPLDPAETDPMKYDTVESWFAGGLPAVRELLAKGPYADPTPQSKASG